MNKPGHKIFPLFLSRFCVQYSDTPLFSKQPEFKPDENQAEVWSNARRRTYPVRLHENPPLFAGFFVQGIKIPVIGAEIHEIFVKRRRGENIFSLGVESNFVFPCHRAIGLIDSPEVARIAAKIK